MSGSFAEQVLDARLPPSFVSGNKVLLPPGALHAMQSDAQQQDDLDWLEASGGLTFELCTAAGLRTYCGVLEFSAPEDNVVVVPDWVRLRRASRARTRRHAPLTRLAATDAARHVCA